MRRALSAKRAKLVLEFASWTSPQQEFDPGARKKFHALIHQSVDVCWCTWIPSWRDVNGPHALVGGFGEVIGWRALCNDSSCYCFRHPTAVCSRRKRPQAYAEVMEREICRDQFEGDKFKIRRARTWNFANLRNSGSGKRSTRSSLFGVFLICVLIDND